MNTAEKFLYNVQTPMVTVLLHAQGELLYNIWANRWPQPMDLGVQPDAGVEEELYFKRVEERWCDFAGLCRWAFPTDDVSQEILNQGLQCLQSYMKCRQENPLAPPATDHDFWPLL